MYKFRSLMGFLFTRRTSKAKTTTIQKQRRPAALCKRRRDKSACLRLCKWLGLKKQYPLLKNRLTQIRYCTLRVVDGRTTFGDDNSTSGWGVHAVLMIRDAGTGLDHIGRGLGHIGRGLNVKSFLQCKFPSPKIDLTIMDAGAGRKVDLTLNHPYRRRKNSMFFL